MKYKTTWSDQSDLMILNASAKASANFAKKLHDLHEGRLQRCTCDMLRLDSMLKTSGVFLRASHQKAVNVGLLDQIRALVLVMCLTKWIRIQLSELS